MDTILAQAIALVIEAFKLREQWWDSLSPAKKTELADKMADAEIRWLTFLEFVANLGK